MQVKQGSVSRRDSLFWMCKTETLQQIRSFHAAFGLSYLFFCRHDRFRNERQVIKKPLTTHEHYCFPGFAGKVSRGLHTIGPPFPTLRTVQLIPSLPFGCAPSCQPAPNRYQPRLPTRRFNCCSRSTEVCCNARPSTGLRSDRLSSGWVWVDKAA